MRTEPTTTVGEQGQAFIAELYSSLLRFASTVRAPDWDGNDLVQEAFVRCFSPGFVAMVECNA